MMFKSAQSLFILFFLLPVLVSCSPGDEALDPAVQKILPFSTPEIPVEQNAYVALLGLHAPTGTDFIQAGEEKNQRLKAGQTKDLETGWLDMGRYRNESLQADNKDYLQEMRNKAEAITQTVKDNQEILDRYAKMLRMPRYQSMFLQYDYIPNFIELRDLSDLYEDVVIVELLRGNTAKGLEQLQQNSSFYQRIIESEPLALIEYTIFIHIIDRHNRRISKLIAGNVMNLNQYGHILDDLVIPLTSSEQYFAASMEIERIYGINMLNKISNNDALFYTIREDDAYKRRNIPEKIYARLLYKKNHTLNIVNQQWDQTIDTVRNLPIANFPQAWAAFQVQNSDQQTKPILDIPRLYQRYGVFFLKNILGEILLAISQPDYVGFLARAHERTAYAHLVRAQLAVKLAAPKDEEIEAFLAGLGPEARNPYTGGPFSWDKERHTLWFQPAFSEGKDREEVSSR